MKFRPLRLAALALAAAIALSSCDSDSPIQPTDCTDVTLTPATFSFPSAGGTGSIAVAIPAGCTWTAQSQAPWIAITSGASGSGPGTVAFTAGENTSESPRSGAVAVAGRSVTVTQAGREPGPECMYDVAPESTSAGREGGTGTVTVSAPDGCTWTASSQADWLTIVAGGSGSGDGIVTYAATENRDAEERNGVLVVADRPVTITQEPDLGACLYSVTPVEFAPCMPATQLSATITTQDVCPWTATPDVSWIGVAVADGRGSGTVRFSITANYDAPRFGQVLVRWPTPTAGQNLRVSQAGCIYFVSPNAFAVPAGGGQFSFDVLQESEPNVCGGPLQDACQWSAVADADWITVTTTMPRTGDARVQFSVAPNTTGASRTGRIRVRDQLVQIAQQ